MVLEKSVFLVGLIFQNNSSSPKKQRPVNTNDRRSILSKGVVGVGCAGDCQPISGAARSNLGEKKSVTIMLKRLLNSQA